MIQYSANELKKFESSLDFLKKHIDFFSIRFFHYFLESEASLLFKNNLEKQYEMIDGFLKIIIEYQFNSSQINNYLVSVAKRHTKYGLELRYINYFISSFLNAWKELYDYKYDEGLYNLWKRLINEIMTLFKNYLI